MIALEIAANGFVALGILLAARNSIHSWWLGIIGCSLFAILFWRTQLYADVTLQGFFIASSVVGWWQWLKHGDQPALPITHSSWPVVIGAALAALIVTAGYGLLLHRYTDAYAPFWDSAVLAGSVIGQLLLIRRKVANWGFWLAVNSIAVPLYASRGLWLTAVLYAVYWINALIALRRWAQQAERQPSARIFA